MITTNKFIEGTTNNKIVKVSEAKSKRTLTLVKSKERERIDD